MCKSVAIINSSHEYEQLFISRGWEIADDNQEASLVVFTGGEDVSPHIYDHPPHHTTYSSWERDKQEMALLSAFPDSTPCVGICRGAQFLNVMAGGEMYQDVSDHTRAHYIRDATTGDEVFCTSTHHQMMKPSSEAILVASSTIGGTRAYWSQEQHSFVTEKSKEDYEVVFYPSYKFLCFQPHPEMSQQYPRYEPMRDYFFHCLNKYLGV
jgi:gamma-glutamyl-gamma-aminobutyrate hydrolase PuuD